MHFILSKAEYDSCQFLVAYWFERGQYFVVPKSELKPATKAKKSYRFIANILKNGDYNAVSKRFLDRWDRITNLLK